MTISTRSLYGMGSIVPIPGSGYCQDTVTGNVVLCDSAPTVDMLQVEALPEFIAGPTQTATGPASGFTIDITVADLNSRLQQTLEASTNDYSLRAGLSATPDQFYQNLLGEATMFCNQYPAACANADAVALVTQYADYYKRWYDSNLLEYSTLVARGSIEAQPGAPPPPAGFVQPKIVSGPGYQQSTNALERVMPREGMIQPTSGGNGLRPPTGAPAVTAQQIEQATGTTDLTTRPGDSGALPATDWLQDNWILLAAAAAALLLVPAMTGGRQ